MAKPDIISMLKEKGADKKKIAGLVIGHPACIEDLIEVIKTEQGALKFSCDKVIQLVSEKKPELVYPYFDFFVSMLKSDNNFLKWGAIITLGHLSRADKAARFSAIFDQYFALLRGPSMVAAANVIKMAPVISAAIPALTEKIIAEILKVEEVEYLHHGEVSPECNRIVCGEAVDTFFRLFPQIDAQAPVIAFIRRQQQSSREKVRKKAEKFLKKYAPV